MRLASLNITSRLSAVRTLDTNISTSERFNFFKPLKSFLNFVLSNVNSFLGPPNILPKKDVPFCLVFRFRDLGIVFLESPKNPPKNGFLLGMFRFRDLGIVFLELSKNGFLLGMFRFRDSGIVFLLLRNFGLSFCIKRLPFGNEIRLVGL